MNRLKLTFRLKQFGAERYREKWVRVDHDRKSWAEYFYDFFVSASRTRIDDPENQRPRRPSNQSPPGGT